MPKIVIVEDEPTLVKALNLELLDKGFEIISVVDGAKAYDVIKEAKPHLVLLDIVLPGVTGLDILDKVKADPDLKSVPVVMFTNLDQIEEKERASKAGAAAYYVKSEVSILDVPKIIETHMLKE